MKHWVSHLEPCDLSKQVQYSDFSEGVFAKQPKFLFLQSRESGPSVPPRLISDRLLGDPSNRDAVRSGLAWLYIPEVLVTHLLAMAPQPLGEETGEKAEIEREKCLSADQWFYLIREDRF